MNRILIFIFVSGFSCQLFSQPAKSLTLEQCHQLVQENDPAALRAGLLAQQTTLNQAQIEADKKPVIRWNASAAIQTETIELPFEIPGFDPLDLPLYRAQTTLDAQYTIYDGGLIKARLQAESAAAIAALASVEVELENLKPQINEYYFGVLLARTMVSILSTSKENLERKIKTLEAGEKFGVILPSEVDKLRVETLRLAAQIDQTEGNIAALIAILEQLTGIPIDPKVTFSLPSTPSLDNPVPLKRAELALFESQKASIFANASLIEARRKPKLGAFAQAGFGYPNPLNFFDNSVSPFATGGLNFTWNFLDWGKDDRDRQLLTVQSQIIDNQRAAFEHRINALEKKYLNDLVAMNRQIDRDQEIVQLESKILKQVSSQLDNGIITSTIYLDQVDAETQSRLNLEAHLLQLEKIKIDYLTQRGAF